MKKLLYFWILSGLFISCQDNPKEVVSAEQSKTKSTQSQQSKAQEETQEEGQALVKQYCMSCHLTTPDPSKRDKMLAPPLVRVAEHYKSAFPDKKDFVKAIIDWANHPNQEASLMPGAARKFGLMPAMPIGDDKLEKIAAYLYEADFGQFGKFRHGSKKKMHLPNGIKYSLAKRDINQVHQAISLLSNADMQNVTDYRKTGKEVFNVAKNLLMNKKYEDETMQQVQLFFHQIEDDMHHLMSVNSKADGEKYRKLVLNKMQKFDAFFKTNE